MAIVVGLQHMYASCGPRLGCRADPCRLRTVSLSTDWEAALSPFIEMADGALYIVILVMAI
jgi:hypothetical protein